jgi:hypothetical protein
LFFRLKRNGNRQKPGGGVRRMEGGYIYTYEDSIVKPTNSEKGERKDVRNGNISGW